MRLKRTRLGVDDFEPLKVIGRGAFGEVSMCGHRVAGLTATVLGMRLFMFAENLAGMLVCILTAFPLWLFIIATAIV